MARTNARTNAVKHTAREQRAAWIGRLKLVNDICDRLEGQDLTHIADRAKVSPSTLYMWMNGDVHAPRIDTLTRVARILGFRIDLIRERKRRLTSVK